MPLTSVVDDKTWTLISPTNAERLACTLDPSEAGAGCVYFIVADTAPSNAKDRPGEGDHAVAISLVFGRDSVIFTQLLPSDGVYARASSGFTKTVLATTKA